VPCAYAGDLQAIVDFVQVILVGFVVAPQQRLLRALLGFGLVRCAEESPRVVFAEHARPVTADVDEVKVQSVARRRAQQCHAVTRDAVEEAPGVHVQPAWFAEPAVQQLIVHGFQ